jgi:hypothetical protein
MNDTLTRNSESFYLEENGEKKGCGCLGILSAFLLIVISLIAALWILFMHTSYPLKYVVNLIEALGSDSNLKLSKPSGSISSGIGFQKITWDNGEISDMKFRYSGIMDVINEKKLIIHEMSIGSAKIYTDSGKNSLTETTTGETTDTEDPSSVPRTTKSSGKQSLKLIQIDRISLNKITIENRITGKTIDIPKIEWTGFKAEPGGEVQLGNLETKSDHLTIRSTDIKTADYRQKVEIELLPKMNETILKPIDIEALIGFKDGEEIVNIRAFDGTLTFEKNAMNTVKFVFRGTNLNEYIDSPLPNQINLEASATDPDQGTSAITMSKGTLVLGQKNFEIQPVVNETIVGSGENVKIRAICRDGENEIRYEIPFNQNTPGSAIKSKLNSSPEMAPEDLMAFIYHNRKFSELDAAQQQKIRKYMKDISFEK